MDRISAAISNAQTAVNFAAVVAIDLDRFKTINDTYGHECGDTVLQELAVRMKQSLRDGEAITRLGGDEFVFLTAGFESINEIQLAIIRLLDNVCQPLQCEGVILAPRVSCGIAVFPSNGDSATKLLTNADRALYRAKGLGEGHFAFAS